MRQDVQQIISAIDSLNQQLESIRASCPHVSFKVKPYQLRPGAIHPRRICDDCGGIAGGLTPEEETEFWTKRDHANNLSFKFED